MVLKPVAHRWLCDAGGFGLLHRFFIAQGILKLHGGEGLGEMLTPILGCREHAVLCGGHLVTP